MFYKCNVLFYVEIWNQCQTQGDAESQEKVINCKISLKRKFGFSLPFYENKQRFE